MMQLIFIIMMMCACSSMNRNAIPLGSLRWVEQDQNRSVLLNSQDKVILGPGNIQLWGEYPYVYGDIRQNDHYSRFCIDLRTEKKLDAPDRLPIDTHAEQWIAFPSIRGQHGSLLLHEILRRSLKPGATGGIANRDFRIPHTALLWKPVQGGQSMIVNDSDQRVILGPGSISLWGKYPYIYGRMWINPRYIYFVLDVETNKLEQVPPPSDIFARYMLPGNSLSLLRWEMVMGDWAGAEHARSLLEEAMRPLPPGKDNNR